ncbi:MAG: hypothetical protein HKO57_00775, partial [Akkermansiaceae bacterium]|nr:hypothetical protein [Akkermansiaceae bacterium]
MKSHLLLLAGMALAPFTHAASLQSATVTRVINDVRIYSPGADGRTASTGDVIRGRNSLHTGRRSRSELRFQDNTITRLGANSIFSFAQGTRDLQLEQGTLLLQVPRNAGGARIRTATVTASITGTTILMEFFAGKWVKIIVLEGRLEAFLNTVGRRVTILAGQMLVMRANDRRVPQPVDIDLKRNVETSPLASARLFGA